MERDEELVECPSCGADVLDDLAGSFEELECEECGYVFPETD